MFSLLVVNELNFILMSSGDICLPNERRKLRLRHTYLQLREALPAQPSGGTQW